MKHEIFGVNKKNYKELWRNKKASKCKKSNVLASKLRPVKVFKGEKCYFTVEKVIAQPPSVTGGAIYDKDPPLTMFAW